MDVRLSGAVLSYLLELLAIEEVAQELLDTRNTGGATNKDDLVNLVLRHARVLEDLLDGVEGARESLGVKVLETGTGDGGVEVLTIEERVNLDGGLGSVGQGTLSTLASSAETTESTSITGEILASLALELLLEVLKEVSVEILTTKVSVTGGSLDSEDTTLDVQQGHIEGTTTEIVDEDVTLLLRLAGAETVGDSGSSRLVDNTENVQASDGTGILGGLTLVVVEVGGHGDDSLLNLLAELDLSDLFHLSQLVSKQIPQKVKKIYISPYLHEDHGGDLLGREDLGLVEVLNLDDGVATLVDDLEGPGLNILLDDGVLEAATDQTPVPFELERSWNCGECAISRIDNILRRNLNFKIFFSNNSLDIEDGVGRVHGGLVLGGITNQTLLVGERDEGGGSVATLVVGN